MRRFLLLFLLASAAACDGVGQLAPVRLPSPDPHATPEWAVVAPHLPDLLQANAEQLEMGGDVLRARRFPADAAVFYRAALEKQGHPDILLKKLGVVYLEIQQTDVARSTFQHAIKVNKGDAEAWNDLAATDFTLGNARNAVGEYKKAIKLKKTSAVFHANLALAYFELKDADAARAEFRRALRLDPGLMQHTTRGGYNMQLLSSAHYAEMCFEMARMYAAQGDQEAMLQSLTKAAERGMDVQKAMAGDGRLKPFLRDPRVVVMLANVEQMHTTTVAKVRPPSLGEATGK